MKMELKLFHLSVKLLLVNRMVVLPFVLTYRVSKGFSLELLDYLTSYKEVHSNYFNVILCSKLDGFGIVKTLSWNFQRYIDVQTADEGLLKRTFLEEPQTFILDLHCSESKTILTQAEELNLFRRPYKWIIMADGIENNEIYTRVNGSFLGELEESYWNLLETLTPLVDSDIRIIEGNHHEKVTVSAVYKLIKSRTLLKESLAEFTVKNGLVILNTNSIASRRMNLQGIVIPTSLVITHNDSLNHLEDTVDKHVDTVSKCGYNTYKLVEDLFNVSLTYKIQDSWGVLENGSWNGMVGDLKTGESEIGITPLFFRPERLSVLEYFATVTPTRLRFILMSPPLSFSSNIFTLPFNTMVWYSCAALVVVSCLLLYLAIKIEGKVSKTSKNEIIIAEDNEKISFVEVLLLNFGAICLQGTAVRTRKPSGRIITLFLYFSYMFLYTSYSACIVALLQSPDTSIRTLSDLLSSPLKAGADDVVYSKYYFKTAVEPVRKALYEKKVAPKGEPPNFLPVEEGIKKVRQGLYAYHAETSSGYLIVQKIFTEEEKCGLQEIKTSFIPLSDPWLTFRKRSHYAELLKIGLKRIIECGLKTRTVRRYFTFKPICRSKSSRFVSVGLADCYYAFVLLFSGFIVSFSVMIMEIIFKKNLKKRRKNRQMLRGRLIVNNGFIN